jgi:hypothetical protein
MDKPCKFALLDLRSEAVFRFENSILFANEMRLGGKLIKVRLFQRRLGDLSPERADMSQHIPHAAPADCQRID